jgi:hypothetical protein
MSLVYLHLYLCHEQQQTPCAPGYLASARAEGSGTAEAFGAAGSRVVKVDKILHTGAILVAEH